MNQCLNTQRAEAIEIRQLISNNVILDNPVWFYGISTIEGYLMSNAYIFVNTYFYR